MNDEQIKALVRRGDSIRDIADASGLTTGQVSGRVTRLGGISAIRGEVREHGHQGSNPMEQRTKARNAYIASLTRLGKSA